MKQSENSRINPDFEKPMIADENYRDFTFNDVDISKNWGRIFVCTRSRLYGSSSDVVWERVFIKSYLKKSCYNLVKTTPSEIIEIRLFDLYSNPSEQRNREKQRAFWEKLNLRTIISDYVKSNPLDMTAWLMSRVAKKKKAKQVK